MNSRELLAILLMVLTILDSPTAIAVLNAETPQVVLSKFNPNSLTPWKPRPVLGPQKTLLLLVEFQNVRSRNSLANIRWLMSTVDQWFRRASYGKMLIDYTINEQVLTLPSIMADYGTPTSGERE